MEITISPTVHAICMKSSAYEMRFERDQLNICNITRSFFWCLFKVAWWSVIAGVCLNALILIPYMMVLMGVWLPSAAMGALMDVNNSKDIIWPWWLLVFMFVSAFLSALIYVVCLTILVVLVPVIFSGYQIWKQIPRKAVAQATLTVLTPVTLVAKFAASHHDKFCMNVKSEVAMPKETFAERLTREQAEELVDYEYNLRRLSRASFDRQLEITREHLIKASAFIRPLSTP